MQVERGAGVNASEAAKIIAATLGDARGWQTRDKVRFRAVSPAAVAEGKVDMTIVLASPELTDKLCAPLETQGQVSCFNLRKVVLNVRRWTEGVPGYGTNLAAYRQYMVNHEVGHGLYHGHVACPGAGQPAPIMLQQTKGLDGCAPNPWPTVG
ncbi:membrane protein [Knoellia subterranea KCTC 19937]|uniref:Membrane protein n=1 Tax=Knoellia subterranea KCTC 19937 TaxID=1385521 RepID=A0A0A0JH46_9MICO|nr:membrane protein [Knoellia subterranea KCTC 19937]